MKDGKNRKSFIECFFNFLSDPENLTQEEIRSELKNQGIDTDKLEKRVEEIVRKGSEERRLAWLKKARKRRAEIEKILDSKQIAAGSKDLKNKIKEILEGRYGQAAFSFAESYFRKKESLSEEDLKSLIEDIERLELLKEQNKKEE